MDPKLKLFIAIAILRRRSKRKSANYWIHPIIQRREVWGEHLKMDEMKLMYPAKFFEYTRMKPSRFDFLLMKIHSIVEKPLSNFREPIHPRIRLYVTLR